MTQMTIQKNKSIGIKRKILYPFTVKDIVKDTDEQPKEEVHGWGLEESWTQELLSYEFGVCTLPIHGAWGIHLPGHYLNTL